MANTDTVTPLVSVDRGRYLRQHESKIRSAAITALAASHHKPDLLIQNALNAVNYCDDFFDRHEVAATANRAANREHLAVDHERFCQKAMQLKLRTLDQLAHVVGY
jgi:hypothetical protein